MAPLLLAAPMAILAALLSAVAALVQQGQTP